MKRILVIQTAFLGDAILSTPLLKGLNEIFPNAKVDILCLPQTKSIFFNNPYVNEVIIFNKRNIKYKFFSFLKVLMSLRKKRYQLGISIQSSLTSSLFMKLSKITTKHGFSRQKFLDMSVNHGEVVGAHKVDKILRLLKPFSNKKFSSQTELYYSNNDKQFVTKFIPSNNEKIIAIAPGSVWFTKKWPQKYYQQLVELLVEDGFYIILIGGQEDHELCQNIKGNSKVLNLAGKLSILQSAAIIEKCNLLLSNDSAPLHIGNAVKTDVVAIFGPTVKELGFYPFREKDFIIEKSLSCRPCGTHGGNKCPLNHFKCMLDISVKNVYQVIKEKLI